MVQILAKAWKFIFLFIKYFSSKISGKIILYGKSRNWSINKIPRKSLSLKLSMWTGLKLVDWAIVSVGHIFKFVLLNCCFIWRDHVLCCAWCCPTSCPIDSSSAWSSTHPCTRGSWNVNKKLFDMKQALFQSEHATKKQHLGANFYQQ